MKYFREIYYSCKCLGKSFNDIIKTTVNASLNNTSLSRFLRWLSIATEALLIAYRDIDNCSKAYYSSSYHMEMTFKDSRPAWNARLCAYRAISIGFDAISQSHEVCIKACRALQSMSRASRELYKAYRKSTNACFC